MLNDSVELKLNAVAKSKRWNSYGCLSTDHSIHLPNHVIKHDLCVAMYISSIQSYPIISGL